jgi:hypothetical protein
LEVFLDCPLVANGRFARVCSSSAERPALAEQIPAAVELDLDLLQPLSVGLERGGICAVALLTGSQRVLFAYQALDTRGDAIVAHHAPFTGLPLGTS